MTCVIRLSYNEKRDNKGIDKCDPGENVEASNYTILQSGIPTPAFLTIS